jgi:hypothetical protein
MLSHTCNSEHIELNPRPALIVFRLNCQLRDLAVDDINIAGESVQAELVEIVQVRAALGAEIEGDRDLNVALERLAFPLAPCLPLVGLLESLALCGRWCGESCPSAC